MAFTIRGPKHENYSSLLARSCALVLAKHDRDGSGRDETHICHHHVDELGRSQVIGHVEEFDVRVVLPVRHRRRWERQWIASLKVVCSSDETVVWLGKPVAAQVNHASLILIRQARQGKENGDGSLRKVAATGTRTGRPRQWIDGRK